jgi:hypothetical protein
MTRPQRTPAAPAIDCAAPRIDLGQHPDHPQNPDGGPKIPTPRAVTPGREGVPAPRVRRARLAGRVGRPARPRKRGCRPRVAAAAGRFAEADLLAIIEHRATGAGTADLVVVDQAHSAGPGTASWAGFTTTGPTPTTSTGPTTSTSPNPNRGGPAAGVIKPAVQAELDPTVTVGEQGGLGVAE